MVGAVEMPVMGWSSVVGAVVELCWGAVVREKFGDWEVSWELVRELW